MKLIYDGLSLNGDDIVYNDSADSPDDLMNLISPDIYKSEFGGNIYYFGYAFNDNASKKDRSTIIRWLKNIGDSSIDEVTLRKFIDKPLRYFDIECDLSSFSALISPKSGRSYLTKVIVNELYKFTQHDLERCSFELIKSLPQDVEFDWNAFDYDYDGEIGNNQYKQIHDYIENFLMPKIHNLTYFSIADSVKPKYRQYIKKYLNIDKKAELVIESIQNGKILIVDDINTSGATLTEILRIVRAINSKCEIYIFTLIGKD